MGRTPSGLFRIFRLLGKTESQDLALDAGGTDAGDGDRTSETWEGSPRRMVTQPWIRLADFVERCDLRELNARASALDADDAGLQPLVPLLGEGAAQVFVSPPPAFPCVANELLEWATQTGTSAEELTRLVARDPLTTVEVVRTAHSARFRGAAAADLQELVDRLGADEIVGIAATAGVKSLVSPVARDAFAAHGPLWTAAWADAVATSQVASWLAAKLTQVSPSVAHLGGLLHGATRVLGVLAVAAGERSQRLPRLGEKHVTRLVDLATPKLRTDLIHHGRFPPALAAMCRGVDAPASDGAQRRAAQIVGLVACVARVVGGELPPSSTLEAASDAGLELYIDRALLHTIADRVRDARAKALASVREADHIL